MTRPTPERLAAVREGFKGSDVAPVNDVLAEIDALTAELDAARTEASHAQYDLHYARQERDKALAACAALRAALEVIERGDPIPGYPEPQCWERMATRLWARMALAGRRVPPAPAAE